MHVVGLSFSLKPGLLSRHTHRFQDVIPGSRCCQLGALLSTFDICCRGMCCVRVHKCARNEAEFHDLGNVTSRHLTTSLLVGVCRFYTTSGCFEIWSCFNAHLACEFCRVFSFHDQGRLCLELWLVLRYRRAEDSAWKTNISQLR